MRVLPSPRGRAGRLELAGALLGWLRGCKGAHIYNAPQALSTAGEAQGLRDFAFEPLGAVDEAQEKLLRCGRACRSHGRRSSRLRVFVLTDSGLPLPSGRLRISR